MKRKKNSLISVEEISTEREIAEIQLERLKQISRERLFTYEESKIYDLLTKNLLLTRGEATTITASSQRLAETSALSEEILTQIAQSVDEDLVNRSLEVIDDKPKS